jgi:hypothetical protein
LEAPTAPLRSISIAPTTDAKGKSRSFSAELLAIVAANSLWPSGETAPDGTLRPLLVAYAASDLQARAFTANLRAGRPARSTDRRPDRLRFEIPRSAGFRFETHSADGATLTLAYQPTVFAMQPGGLEDGRLRFIAMPPTWWVEREAETMADLGADAREAALAAYFVAYLDRHSPYPIANDRRFHLAPIERHFRPIGATRRRPLRPTPSVSMPKARRPSASRRPSPSRHLKPPSRRSSPRSPPNIFRRNSWRRPLMARPESVAHAGYFPFPTSLLPAVASLVEFEHQPHQQHVLVDPCAGDGRTIEALAGAWFSPRSGAAPQAPRLYAVEIERGRFRQLDRRVQHAHHGDAFRFSIGGTDLPGEGSSLLFLNPPYDVDRLHGRLEQRFLERWTSCLAPGAGLLVFVVPHYSLAASAGFLARHYENLGAWRFPGAEFEPFRQCVLFAKRRAVPVPENEPVRRQVERWADDASLMPELPTLARATYTVAIDVPRLHLEPTPIDLRNLLADFRPWLSSVLVGTDRTVSQLIGATYPVALPHAAYVALTRHREGVHLFADRERFPSRAQLDRTLSRDGRKDLASDYSSADLRRAVSRYQEIATKILHATREERPLREALAAHERLRDTRLHVIDSRRSLFDAASRVYVDPAKAFRGLVRDPAALDNLRRAQPTVYGELRGRSSLLGMGKERAAAPAVAALTGRLEAYRRSLAGLEAAKRDARELGARLSMTNPSKGIPRRTLVQGAAAIVVSRRPGRAATRQALRRLHPTTAQLHRQLNRLTSALRAYRFASQSAQDAIEVAIRGMGRVGLNSALLLLPPKVAIPVGIAARTVERVLSKALELGLER